MAKKEEFIIDDSELELPVREVASKTSEESTETKKVTRERNRESSHVSCLRNERLIVRHVPKLTGIWGNNPKHVLSGGIAENSVKTFVVPRLNSGLYVNILTDEEKAFLEDAMGLEYNALSIYKKKDNFWDDGNEEGINKVRLGKQESYLDLSDPEDYIRYKILLANKDYVAPSLRALQDTPKATYQYVIVSENDESKIIKANVSVKMQCYKEFGKIEDDKDTLRTILEIVEGKPTASNSKIEFLQNRVNDLIQLDAKTFLKTITDPVLPTKVLIKKCIEAGLIANRGNFLYLKKDNTPLCENGEDPTLSIAAKYLSNPKHQEVRFLLEAKLKE